MSSLTIQENTVKSHDFHIIIIIPTKRFAIINVNIVRKITKLTFAIDKREIICYTKL